MTDDQARDTTSDEAIEDLAARDEDTEEVTGGITMVEHNLGGTAIGSATGGAGAGKIFMGDGSV
jgi:hypothetical protein